MQGPLTLATIQSHLAFEPAGELDLSGVTQIDSAGLSLLLELKRRAQKRGAVLGFTQVTPAVKHLANHFGVSEILGIRS